MTTKDTSKQRGNVLFMILIAVALMGALTAVMMRNGGDQATSLSADRISSELKAQAQSNRSALVECTLINNYGYPPAAYNGPMGDVECQVDDTPTYQPIFTGTANRFMPPPPSGFNAWQYNNDGAGTIYMSIDNTTSPGDAAVISALEMLKTQYSATEVAIVNDGATASFRLNITTP